MNSVSTLDPALIDRLNISHIDPYTKDDISNIIAIHFLPKAIKNAGLAEDCIKITSRACASIQLSLLNAMSLEGLRPVEKYITDLVSKINLYSVWNTEVGEDNPFELSFKIPNFTGFPYLITRVTIENNPAVGATKPIHLSYFS